MRIKYYEVILKSDNTKLEGILRVSLPHLQVLGVLKAPYSNKASQSKGPYLLFGKFQSNFCHTFFLINPVDNSVFHYNLKLVEKEIFKGPTTLVPFSRDDLIVGINGVRGFKEISNALRLTKEHPKLEALSRIPLPLLEIHLNLKYLKNNNNKNDNIAELRYI